ncbi:sodium-dependent nutrient amino acid transporter 1-like [Onthophagus taurus]|uniref:sodium-dependent nutrient amino acid transporter 1-like n=1 Tax=Onthophagus taurus TaxID=166361 RepID=UPI0039BE1650
MFKKKSYAFDNPSFENVENNTTKIENAPIKKERKVWDNSWEFLMSCIAMSVGLGNVWRFPFTAYENGGGAFLIPYLIVLLVVGRPMYYLEMSLGQFSSTSVVKVFGNLAPALKGIGYGQFLGSICVSTYYCALMAIILFYFVNSFTGELPWATCRPEWDLANMTCIPATFKSNESVTLPAHGSVAISSSELYFRMEVLKEKDDISDGLGTPDWRLTICLFVSWIITFMVSCKGVSSSGKAAYFLALFPYVIMLALLIRAVTLPGAGEGILFFIRPQWDKLLDASVWYAAVSQCFFSLGVGFGTIVIYSSYNNFDHNINRDAMIITTLDTFTSLLAGTTIFGILGNLAYEMNVNVDSVINSGGNGLAFISYPDAIAKFDVVPWLFAILFFGMLFILGVGTNVALQIMVNTVISESLTNLKSWQVSGLTATIGFLIGLVYVTPGGQFILNLVDFYGGTFIIFVLVVFEVICVFWIYGLNSICDDIYFMVSKQVHWYWRLTWGILTPGFLIIIFFYFVITNQKLTYGGLEYPEVASGCGWGILGICMLQFVMWTTYYFYQNKNEGFSKMIKKSFSSVKWRPKRTEHYENWKLYKLQKEKEIVGESRAKKIFKAIFNFS